MLAKKESILEVNPLDEVQLSSCFDLLVVFFLPKTINVLKDQSLINVIFTIIFPIIPLFTIII